jgi:cyclophilin family peptidyl-prolyl cis-trans isomerase
VEELASAAAAPEAHLAITALESLARIGPPARSVAQAIASQARADPLPIAIRSAALDAVARIDSATAFEVAGELAAASAWRLRAAAARAFALLERPAGPRFDRLIRDPDPRVVNAALQAAIDEAGDSVAPLRPLLVAQLATGDAIVRSTALTALARIADPSLLPPLLDAYDRAQRDTLNDAALAAVAAIGAVAREGTHPARAFFARFPRSADALVRSRVAESFDSAAVAAAWGAALPVDTERSPAEYRALVDELVAPVLAGGAAPAVAVETAGGTIVLRLFPLEATLTVESFLTLARTGYFDGQEWPRVVGNFVVQGGDPRGDTSGGPGYTIRDEINRHRYGVGTLGMALAGRDTGGSQFFVTHSPQPHLDGIYAVFGEVETGQELTERILPAHTIDRIRRLP